MVVSQGVYMQKDQVLTAGVWWEKMVVSQGVYIQKDQVLSACVWYGEDGGQSGGLHAARPGGVSWCLVSGWKKRHFIFSDILVLLTFQFQ